MCVDYYDSFPSRKNVILSIIPGYSIVTIVYPASLNLATHIKLPIQARITFCLKHVVECFWKAQLGGLSIEAGLKSIYEIMDHSCF